MTRKSTKKSLLILAAGCMFAAAVAATMWTIAPGSSSGLAHLATAAVGESYRTAPLLVLVLAVAMALPLLTVGLSLLRALFLGCAEQDEAEHSASTLQESISVPGGQPFVEVQVGDRGMQCPLLRDMLRIGREDDNDVRIPSNAVHRYHAAIHREDSDDWHITDLSGTPGSGIFVNGRRCAEARLSDGDVIQLGPGRLRFHAGCA